MTKFKALGVLQSRSYVLEKFGQEGVDRIKRELTPAAWDVVYSEQRMATDWVELDACIEHMEVLDRVLGNGDGQTALAMIREITQQHYQSLYRAVVTNATPRSVLEKSSRMWGRYYDRGESSVEFPGETFALKRIIKAPDLPLHHEWLISPYYDVLLRMCGAEDVSTRHIKCVAHGADQCVTEVRWRAPKPVHR